MHEIHKGKGFAQKHKSFSQTMNLLLIILTTSYKTLVIDRSLNTLCIR